VREKKAAPYVGAAQNGISPNFRYPGCGASPVAVDGEAALTYAAILTGSLQPGCGVSPAVDGALTARRQGSFVSSRT
jgi:hypothetical protein